MSHTPSSPGPLDTAAPSPVHGSVALARDAARNLISAPRGASVADTLERIVAGAVASLPHVQRAGISLQEADGSVLFRAPSDDVVAQLDAVQIITGQGPALEAMATGQHVVVTDLAAAGAARWPGFGSTATQCGMGAVCSLGLFARQGGTAWALNLYSEHVEVAEEAGLAAAEVFASYAALALDGALQVEQMTSALDSRDMIGQAKGVLIQRHGLSADEAFATLVESSQHSNMKLHAVARWLVQDTQRQRRNRPRRP